MLKKRCSLILLAGCVSYAMGGENDAKSAMSKIAALQQQLGVAWIYVHEAPGKDIELYSLQVNMRALLPKVGLTEIPMGHTPQLNPHWRALHANLDAISQKVPQK
jgi:hypothetical protein